MSRIEHTVRKGRRLRNAAGRDFVRSLTYANLEFCLFSLIVLRQDDRQQAFLSACGRVLDVDLLRKEDGTRERAPEELAREVVGLGNLLALVARTLDNDHVAAYGNIEVVSADGGDEGTDDDLVRVLKYVDGKLTLAGRRILFIDGVRWSCGCLPRAHWSSARVRWRIVVERIVVGGRDASG